MKSRRAPVTALAALALTHVLAACEAARPIAAESADASCTRCHGGVETQLGAPPRDLQGNTDPSVVTVGAHTAHVAAPHGIAAAPVPCEACHVVPSTFPAPGHGDGVVQISFGALASQGVTPSWDRTTATCNVYCHGATLAGGSAQAPVWTTVDGTQRQCGSCHGFPPPRPHPQRASWAPSDCGDCHPATAGEGGIIPGGAHIDGTLQVDWASMGCSACHGDETRAPTAQNPQLPAAPPVDVDGESDPSQRGVGAHLAHLTKRSLALPVACVECHQVPASPDHADGAVGVTFGDLATPDAQTPGWNAQAGTCAATYCHGATLGGGTRKTPSWIGGAADAACGTCHGAPPPPPHPSGTTCQVCHPSTVDASGAIRVDAGAHVNGTLDVERFHPAGWTSPTAHGYAANRDVAGCKTCHGDGLDGGVVGISCDTCHGSSWRTTCTFCHGDAQRAATTLNPRLPAAPPVGTEGELGTLQPAVGAHQAHLVAGHVAGPVACTECHALPADIAHMTGQAELTWGALASKDASPSYAGGSCASTYCHGATLAGGLATEPVWTQVDGSQRACDSCHGNPPPAPHPQVTTCAMCHALTVLSDAHPAHVIDVAGGAHVDGTTQVTSYHPEGWATPTEHGYAANRDLASCTACHGTDFQGGAVNVSCDACHATNGHADWKTDCTFCHGDATRPENRPAPPVGTEGESLATQRAVGAHEKHLSGPTLGRAIACAECHGPALPSDISHVDTSVALGWGALATARGTAASFDGTSLGCSNYCHGASLAGGTNTAPVWTGGAAQAACGACHGLPPPAPHPAVPGGLTACSDCHGQTVDAAGNILPDGRHIDGIVQGGHDAEWMNEASPSFHAFAANAGLASCETCHGAGLVGAGSAPACTACHDGGTAVAWGCTMCHGGAENATGAPPKAQWGFRTEAVRVGAHTAHVAGSVRAPAFDCDVCHAKPATAFSAGHVEAETTADVAFTGLAIADGTPAPAWDRTAGTCAVYCHGATLGGGTNKVPSWTGTGQAACGACHGLPPPSPHPVVGTELAGCNACHPETVDATGSLIAPASGGKHVDGVLQATGGHEASWMDTASPNFHAYSANAGLAQCQVCHGVDLAGGASGGPCARCHDGTGVYPKASSVWPSCTMCHGGTDNATGAPPKATWGNAADPVRTGGHSAHVTDGGLAGAIACATCHVVPSSVFDGTHVDAPYAEVAFSGLAATAAPWDRATPTCSSVYCHGATLSGGTNETPLWTGGPDEAGCGSCHGLPPPTTASGSPHPQTTGCGGCHPGYTSATVNLATHVDGQLDLAPLSCSSCHGDSGRAATTLNPQLPAAPPVDTSGNVDSSRVGAHQAHLQDGLLRTAMACTECHAIPTGMGHADGDTDLAWGPLATGTGTVDGTTAPSYAGGTCSATYCHGSTLNAGGTSQTPSWSGGAAAVACGTCHGAPPPAPHPQTTSCGGCHGEGYSATTVDPATHVNGVLDIGELTCTSCHGDSTRTASPTDPRWAAPPVDTHGLSASPQVGAHAVHLDGSSLSTPIACTECHPVPPSFAGHPDGATNFAWGPLATGAITATRSTDPAFTNFSTTTPSFSQGSCSATYCHGSYSGTYTYSYWDYGTEELVYVDVAYSGNAATPAWADGPMTCGSCHGSPPPGYWHSATHGNLAQHRQCQTCHSDASGENATGGTAITDPTRHVDGAVDVDPRWSTSGCRCHY